MWNPPAQHNKLKGHFVYLTIKTLEGETLSVTGSSQGFYVDASTPTSFNPKPRSHPPVYYQSLFTLLSQYSSKFTLALRQRATPTLSVHPDHFAYMPCPSYLGATPWLVSTPEITPDSFRSQASYLQTGYLGSEVLPAAREWNEDFVAIRELPRENFNDRLIRDRFFSRLQGELTVAATKSIISITQGEILPINPNDSNDAKTFIHQNIIFVPAEDSNQAMAHLGGEEAIRVTVAKDINMINHLNLLDIRGLHTPGTVILDYLGERWTAQAILPGLCGPVKLEPGTLWPSEETLKNLSSPKVDNESTNNDDTDSSNKPPTPEINFKIVYGSSDAENPENGHSRDTLFHELAGTVAKHFNLALHTVKDKKGKETELFLSSDTKGVVGLDARRYLIDLCVFSLASGEIHDY